MSGNNWIWLLVVAVVLVIILYNSIKIVQEYERGVVFRLGRLVGAKGPGLFLIIPLLDRIVKIDLRVVTLEIPTQEVISRDNVSVRVNAVMYFRVYDAAKAVVSVTDFIRATLQIAQTSLRSVLGQSELDEILSQRDHINEILQRVIDKQTEPWGIKVSTVEIKDVELPQTMQRAMARQAEAEREKRAKLIHAQGELQASEHLAQAARVIGQQEQTMQLRYLQTLSEIATDKNSTIVFPIPIDLISAFMGNWNNNKPQEAKPVPNVSKDETDLIIPSGNGFPPPTPVSEVSEVLETIPEISALPIGSGSLTDVVAPEETSEPEQVEPNNTEAALIEPTAEAEAALLGLEETPTIVPTAPEAQKPHPPNGKNSSRRR